MRVRVWNAYASNNSGSYTIVGRLPSAEVARSTAETLRGVIDAHTAWRDAWDGASDLEASPLAQFCRQQGLTWTPGQGGWDDWPYSSKDNRPGVAVAGDQIVVHHPYTVGLPPAFGELFYKRGGRVEHEEGHAHHPIVVTATFWWGWTKEERATLEAELPLLIADVTGPSGFLARPNRADCPAVWRKGGDTFGEAPLTVAAIFDDLIEGIAALRALGEARSARLELRLAEAVAADDPLLLLRPSTPAVPRFDVVLLHAGDDPAALVDPLTERTGRHVSRVRALLQQTPPITVARGVMEARARDLAAALEAAGARAELRRNDA
jgi:hypothetical protein